MSDLTEPLTESQIWFESNSSALTALDKICREAYYNSGRLFTPDRDGITSQLAPLMTQYGIRDVQTRVHTLMYQADSPDSQYFYQDVLHGLRVSLPFFQKYTHVPDDYQEIYQQGLKDMQQPDFVATWTLVTVWGTKPD